MTLSEPDLAGWRVEMGLMEIQDSDRFRRIKYKQPKESCVLSEADLTPTAETSKVSQLTSDRLLS